MRPYGPGHPLLPSTEVFTARAGFRANEEERGPGLTRVTWLDECGTVIPLDLMLVEERGKRHLAIRRHRASACDSFVGEDGTVFDKICAALAKIERPGPIVVAIPSDEPRSRIFLVHSVDWLATERAVAKRPESTTRGAPDEARHIAIGNLNASNDVGRNAAERIVGCGEGRRFDDWQERPDTFWFFERPDSSRGRELDGYYVIRTKDEAPPRSLRPATPAGRAKRLDAPDFVAAMVFWLDRALKRARGAPVSALAREALRRLRQTAIIAIDADDEVTSARGRGVRASAQWSTP